MIYFVFFIALLILGILLWFFVNRRSKRAAIVLRGISYSTSYRMGVDWRQCLNSFYTHIVKSLERMGYEVDIYLATYAHDLQDELLECYKPWLKSAAFLQIPIEKSTQADSTLAALSLLKHDVNNYDVVVMTRFDIEYKMPLHHMNVNWNKINLPWQEIHELWLDHQRVGDIIHIFPAHQYQAMVNAIRDCPEHANLHCIYPTLLQQPGVSSHLIHFLLAGFYDSNPEYPNPILSIRRLYAV